MLCGLRRQRRTHSLLTKAEWREAQLRVSMDTTSTSQVDREKTRAFTTAKHAWPRCSPLPGPAAKNPNDFSIADRVRRDAQALQIHQPCVWGVFYGSLNVACRQSEPCASVRQSYENLAHIYERSRKHSTEHSAKTGRRAHCLGHHERSGRSSSFFLELARPHALALQSCRVI